jgi:hypothetical protein
MPGLIPRSALLPPTPWAAKARLLKNASTVPRVRDLHQIILPMHDGKTTGGYQLLWPPFL